MRPKVSVAIMQPTYLPYLGYFELMAAVDHFVFLDDVQFARDSWHQRNRIAGPKGEQRLTIPVIKAPLTTALNAIRIDSSKAWTEVHLSALEAAYAKTPYFDEGIEFVRPYLSGEYELLSELTSALIKQAAKRLGIPTRLHKSTDLTVRPERVFRLVDICAHFEATDYLSPAGAYDYLNKDNILSSSVNIHYQNFVPEPYKSGPTEFIPYLGFIDAIMHLGFQGTANLIEARYQSGFQNYFVK